MIITLLPLGTLKDLPLPATHSITVFAQADYRFLTVHAPCPVPNIKDATLLLGKEPVPFDVLKTSGTDELVWTIDRMKKGESLKFTVELPSNTKSKIENKTTVSEHGVKLSVNNKNVDITVSGNKFATYDVTTGPNKPYIYPMYTASSKQVLRHYGVETITGETHDHPHHRGMWFTHGDVNGVDFWSEDAKAGKTVSTSTSVTSGNVVGLLATSTDWIMPNGMRIATDSRQISVYSIKDARLMDFELTIKPVNGPLVFGDTKEGSFGIRLPDSMRVVGGDGHINSDTGVKDALTWGKKAAWVDYFGSIAGSVEGIAIFDNPSNLRHPTTWHVRDYGLFAVNPFGLHDFENDKINTKKGNFTLESGKSLTFKYRIYIHPGNTSDSEVQQVWNAYSVPPVISVK